MEYNCLQCAVDCVGGDTLKQYQKQFDKCNKDFDLLFSSATGDGDFYRKIVEKGRVYETGYYQCICWKKDGVCACSKQALQFLYSNLLPDRKIVIETVQTICNGADCCIFRIILG